VFALASMISMHAHGGPAAHTGMWNGATHSTPSTHVSDGPLTAGGDFGASFALPSTSSSEIVAFFGKNDVWSDAVFQGGDGWLFQHIATGSLAVSSEAVQKAATVSAS